MRRLIGLLMILAILLPLPLGAVTVMTARSILNEAQTKVNTRVEHISDKLTQVETTINTVSSRFEVLKSVADQVGSAASTAAQNVVKTIDSFKIHIAIPLPAPLPTIPPLDLDVPGLSEVRDFLQNVYDTFASLASAISDITLIGQVPAQIGEAVTEAQGLYTDMTGILASYAQVILIIVVGLVVWMCVIYIVVIYRWLGLGWAMLAGRPAQQT
ncbi:MAG: hypothetical protein GC204_05725 [Chloroflexi bacterium]|nr:hypothetical protein [Chloroflexota bacterium]